MLDATPCLKQCRKCGTEKPLDAFHPEKRGKYGRAGQCKSCRAATSRDWYARNASCEDFKARRRQQNARALRKWRAENAETIRAYMKDWRNANREQITEQARRWRAANPDAVRRKLETRRARKLAAFVAPVNFSEIWDRDNGVCQLCGLPVDRSISWPHPLSKTLDHIVPLSKGGTHEPANVQIAHASCNSRKGDRMT